MSERKAPVTRVKMSYKLMRNHKPVPVAPPSDIIQLTPIIQPIAMVPYSTQAQPMMTVNDRNQKR